VQLSKDYWLQLLPTQSTAKGGRTQERWAVNPKTPESFRQLYAQALCDASTCAANKKIT
jgi:hypothetical protein